MAETQISVADDSINGRIKTVNGVEVLTQKQVCTYLEVSRGTLWKIRKRDFKFPDPVKIGASERQYWRRDELEQWLNDRLKGLS